MVCVTSVILLGCSDDDVCECFASAQSKTSCAPTDADCGTYRGNSGASGNDVVVSSVMDLLETRGEGRFGYHESSDGGQFSTDRTYVVLGDTLVHWGTSHDDLVSQVYATVHRRVPSVADCPASMTASARWSCISKAIHSSERIAVCAEGETRQDWAGEFDVAHELPTTWSQNL